MAILDYVDMDMYMLIGLGILLIVLMIFAFFLHASRRSSRVATDYFEKLNNKEVVLDEVDLLDKKDSKKEESEESKISLKAITDEHYKMYYELLEKHKMQKVMDKFDSDENNTELSDGYMHMNEIAKIMDVELEKVLEYFIKEDYIERESYNLRLTEKGKEAGGRNIDFEGYILIAWPQEIVEQLHVIKRTKKKRRVENKNELIGWFWIIVAIAAYFLLSGG
jgi:hypothetical protein